MKKHLFVLFLAMVAMLLMMTPMAIGEAVDATSADAVPIVHHIDLTQILLTLISVLGAIITKFLIPWLKSRTSESQQEKLLSAARIAVFAAEQLYGSLNGDMKLKYAKAYLQKRGWDVNTDEVKYAIEAMVQELSLMQIDVPEIEKLQLE